MRLLFVHNHYGVRSGEEIMLERIVGLLRQNGHEVDTHFAYSADIQSPGQKVQAALSGVWSQAARRALRDQIAAHRPDLVQVQNLFPLISPAILPVIRDAGVPIVMRLSNYRLICPNGLFLSRGSVCEKCRGGREYHCVVNNCEGSLFKSASYALRNWSARVMGLYRNSISRYYAQTTFQRDVLIAEGYPAQRIDVIPNMIETKSDAPAWSRGSYVGFVGRLSPEKGVDDLIAAAARLPDIPFRLAGIPGRFANDGAIPRNVRLMGHLDAEALKRFYRDAAMIVVPSTWYEGFPSVIIEAMRHSKPVIASAIGGLPEIVQAGRTGLTPAPGDHHALSRAIHQLWRSPQTRQRMGEAGARRVRSAYTPARYYTRLMATYEAALEYA
ncbi:MAG: glycosyltransferase family 4 protein [Pseudomonadota bacterium]